VALRDYASEIFGSKAKIRVLRTLARHSKRVFTVRELARFSGLSHPEVSKVVKELERRGLAEVQTLGRAYSVRLNRESYIFKSVIEPLFAAERDTVRALVSTIKPFFDDDRISSVAIYGSVARGSEGRKSDVDLLVIAGDKELANERVARANDKTLSRFGLALSPLVQDENRFARRRREELESSILDSYILVSGKDLKEIVKSVKGGR